MRDRRHRPESPSSHGIGKNQDLPRGGVEFRNSDRASRFLGEDHPDLWIACDPVILSNPCVIPGDVLSFRSRAMTAIPRDHDDTKKGAPCGCSLLTEEGTTDIFRRRAREPQAWCGWPPGRWHAHRRHSNNRLRRLPERWPTLFHRPGDACRQSWWRQNPA